MQTDVTLRHTQQAVPVRTRFLVVRLPKLESSLVSILLYVIVVMVALILGIAAAMLMLDALRLQSGSALSSAIGIVTAVIVIVGLSALGILSIERMRVYGFRMKRLFRWERLERVCAHADAATRVPHRLLERTAL